MYHISILNTLKTSRTQSRIIEFFVSHFYTTDTRNTSNPKSDYWILIITFLYSRHSKHLEPKVGLLKSLYLISKLTTLGTIEFNVGLLNYLYHISILRNSEHLEPILGLLNSLYHISILTTLKTPRTQSRIIVFFVSHFYTPGTRNNSNPKSDYLILWITFQSNRRS